MANIANKVVEIEGRRCIVIRDEVSVQKPEAVSQLIDSDLLTGDNQLWVSSEVMDELIKKHGELPVYGLWQLIVSSGYLNDDYKVFVLPVNESGDGSHYLYHHNDVWHAGIVYQDELQGLPDTLLEGLTDDDVLALDVDPSELVKPAQRVLSVREKIALRNKERKIVQRQIVAAISAMVAVVFGMERYLDFNHKKENIEYELSQTILTSINATIEILKTDRATYRPDQKADVFPIWYLASTLPEDSIEAKHIRLGDPSAEVILKKAHSDLAKDLPVSVYSARPIVTGEAIINWKEMDSE